MTDPPPFPFVLDPGESILRPPADEPDPQGVPRAEVLQPTGQAPRPAVPLAWVSDEDIAADLDLSKRRLLGHDRAIPVPWPTFAAQLGGGLWPGLHVLVGGTGSGKSTLALQIALCAAQAQCPVAYVGLELEARQVRLRLLAALAGVAWSTLYLGRSPDDPDGLRATHALELARIQAPTLAALPIAVAEATPQGWPASNLRRVAEQIRQQHPDGPALVVLDFLQLIGAEPDNRRADLRERIGAAAYQARALAKDLGVAVLAVSSTARDRYPLLSVGPDGTHEAGFLARKDGQGGVRGTMLNPDALVGCGKESGEVEFAADSVNVLVRWRGDLPATSPQRQTGLLLASPKVRTGEAGWCELRFNGHAFSEPELADITLALLTRTPARPLGGRTSRSASPNPADDY